MKERTRNLLVGVTSIAGLAGLAAILLLFGYIPGWFEPGYDITVDLNHAAGMTVGSAVRYKGVTVGQVKSVALREQNVEVLAKITYESDGRVIDLPRALVVDVDSSFFGGSPSLVLRDAPDSGGRSGATLPRDGTAQLSGRVGTGTGGLANQMRDMLAEPMKRFETLSADWSKVAQNLNRLIEPVSTQAVDEGQAEGNLTTVLARADARLAEMRQVIEGVNTWINDEALRADVLATVGNFKETSENIKEGSQEMRQLMGDAGEQMDKLTKRYIAVADDLSNTLRSVQEVIDKAGQGEGTIGKLLNDPSVYDNLNDALERVNAAIKDVQLLLEKWKKEGVPVRL